MDFYFSASTKRFYASGLTDISELPSDYVKISEEFRMKLLVELTEDKEIVGDDMGHPMVVDKKYSLDEARKLALARLREYHTSRVKVRIPFGPYSFAVSDESLRNLMTAAQTVVFLPDEPVILKVDQDVYEIQSDQVTGLVTDVIAANRQASKTFAEHTKAIQASNDPTEIVRYNYKAGWPE